MYVWPWRLLRAQSDKPQLVGRAVTGGASLSGLQQSSATTGGGFWRLDMTSIDLRTPDAIRCARAWSAYLDGGAQQVIVPFFDLGRAPRPVVNGKAVIGTSPAPSSDYFAQDPAFGTPVMGAYAAAASPLRSTSLSVTVTLGSQLLGGEHFALQHPTKGWRLYRVARAEPLANGAQALEIRPPLREAVAANLQVEFDVPRCVMSLDPAKAADLEPDVSLNRFATVSASFVEAF